MTYDDRFLKADHINLRDGITTDSEGRILSVREDTKIPLKPFNPLVEPETYECLLEMPDVGEETVEFWRAAQHRAPQEPQ